jgi:hypothetical protein
MSTRKKEIVTKKRVKKSLTKMRNVQVKGI